MSRTTLRTTIHRAKRFHQCTGCGCVIAPESIYRVVVSSNPFAVRKECPLCAMESEKVKADTWLVSAQVA